MMELLKNFPPNVLAVKASGQVTKKDYDEVLIPSAKVAFEHHEKLSIYYEITPDFTGFDAGAMWEDLTFGISHWKGWERVAIVTSEDWIKNAATAFRFFIPCPVKIFPPGEIAQARVWLGS